MKEPLSTMTGVFSFCRRKQKCRINQEDPAAIPVALNSLCMVRFSVQIIWSGAVTVSEAVLLPGDMIPDGRKPGRFS